MLPEQGAFRTSAKALIGYSVYFSVFEGLRAISRKSYAADLDLNKRGLDWHFTNFFSGGLAGLSFKAAAVSLYKTPVEMNWRGSFRLVATSFVISGLGGSLIGFVESTTGKELLGAK